MTSSNLNDDDQQSEQWTSIDQGYPYGINCPSANVHDHQTKWRWLVQDLNLGYGEDWILRIPENRRTYDVWCFKNEANAMAFYLKWL